MNKRTDVGFIRSSIKVGAQGNSMKKHPMVTVMPIPKMKLVVAPMSSKIIGAPPARLNSSMAHP